MIVIVFWVFNFFSSWIFVCFIIVFIGKSVIFLGKEELLELSWLELNLNKDENYERWCLKNKNLISFIVWERWRKIGGEVRYLLGSWIFIFVWFKFGFIYF